MEVPPPHPPPDTVVERLTSFIICSGIISLISCFVGLGIGFGTRAVYRISKEMHDGNGGLEVFSRPLTMMCIIGGIGTLFGIWIAYQIVYNKKEYKWTSEKLKDYIDRYGFQRFSIETISFEDAQKTSFIPMRTLESYDNNIEVKLLIAPYGEKIGFAFIETNGSLVNIVELKVSYYVKDLGIEKFFIQQLEEELQATHYTHICIELDPNQEYFQQHITGYTKVGKTNRQKYEEVDSGRYYYGQVQRILLEKTLTTKAY